MPPLHSPSHCNVYWEKGAFWDEMAKVAPASPPRTSAFCHLLQVGGRKTKGVDSQEKKKESTKRELREREALSVPNYKVTVIKM